MSHSIIRSKGIVLVVGENGMSFEVPFDKVTIVPNQSELQMMDRHTDGTVQESMIVSYRCTIATEKTDPVPWDMPLNKRLALAALSGDEDALFPLIDEFLERRDFDRPPEDFVPRKELIEVLKRLEWADLDHYNGMQCPDCFVFSDDTHACTCALAKAIGAKRDM